MPFIKFQTSPKSEGNSGSVAPAISYFAKEDKKRSPEEIGFGFFSSDRTGISPDEAQELIEHTLYSKSLGKDESKYFHVMIGFSQPELEGKSDEELIDFVQKHFATMYLEAGQRHETDPSQLAWCAKLEKTRKYKGDDEKVRQGAKKSGQLKDGDQRHIHIVVARKTLDNRKISPLSNHFRKGKSKGNVTKGFDQDEFKAMIEAEFDSFFKHSREREDSVLTKLAVHRPDLIEQKSFDSFYLSQIAANINKLKKILAPAARKIKTYIRENLIEKIKSYAQNRAEHTKVLRPHLNPELPPLKPDLHNEDIHASTNNAQEQKPFNFNEALRELDEMEVKSMKLPPSEMTEEILRITQLRKEIYERFIEEQKRSDQERKSGQNPDRKKAGWFYR